MFFVYCNRLISNHWREHLLQAPVPACDVEGQRHPSITKPIVDSEGLGLYSNVPRIYLEIAHLGSGKRGKDAGI